MRNWGQSRISVSIDDVQIYRFGEPGYYDFALDAGSYMFGYRQGGMECRAEVLLNAGVSCVFNLAPDCVIEMQ